MKSMQLSKLIPAAFISVIAACATIAPQALQAQAVAPVTKQVTKEEVAANFDTWKAALATKDPKTVANLFAPNAILEPTLSNQVRHTPAGVEAYFVNFLKLSPKPSINERHIEILDETTAIDAGIWTFDLVKEGKPSWVTARYSFVWEKIDGVWRIQMLHSSVMPEPIATRPAPLQP